MDHDKAKVKKEEIHKLKVEMLNRKMVGSQKLLNSATKTVEKKMAEEKHKIEKQTKLGIAHAKENARKKLEHIKETELNKMKDLHGKIVEMQRELQESKCSKNREKINAEINKLQKKEEHIKQHSASLKRKDMLKL